MAVFAILVIAPAALPHFGWFVATRLAAGAFQGLFLAAAFSTATAVVPKERVGRALAIVIAGFSISTVLGLPLGVLAGSVLGWRGALAHGRRVRGRSPPGCSSRWFRAFRVAGWPPRAVCVRPWRRASWRCSR